MAFEIQSTALRRGIAVPIAVSVVLHAVLWVAGAGLHPTRTVETEVIDIEVTPEAPDVQALPEETETPPEERDTPASLDDPDQTAASTTPKDPTPEGYAVDAGIPDAAPDAPPDAPPDARPDARPRPDAAEPDAGVDLDAGVEPMLAGDGGEGNSPPGDGSTPDDADLDAPGTDAAGMTVAIADAGGTGPVDGGEVAVSGTPDAGPVDAGVALGEDAGSGSGTPGTSNEDAVAGAATTAGTAANLNAYFPKGHVVTAMIRFDRLRGTEWADQTEALLKPLPDYELLFGSQSAKLADTFETLVISSPSPQDVTATTLVARTAMARPALRDFLSSTTTITWSTAKGGMLGARSGKLPKGDKRVILSPYQGWFMLAQPGDLGGLTAAGDGDLDTVVATGKLPAWVAGIRKIEQESGTDRGPSLVVTYSLEPTYYDFKGNDYGLGIEGVTAPSRISLAMELIKTGWVIHGNMKFKSSADAKSFEASVAAVQERVANSTLLQRVIGKPLVKTLANLKLSRGGSRISYSTSISILGARQALAAAAQALENTFGSKSP